MAPVGAQVMIASDTSSLPQLVRSGGRGCDVLDVDGTGPDHEPVTGDEIRFTDLEHDWERQHLGNKDLVFKNTFADIERILKTCGDQGTRFEFECYDTAHLYNLAHFLERGLVEPPLFIQSVVGLLGGIGADVEDLLHMRRTAIRLFGDQFEWSTLGAGAAQIRVGTIALALDGNARVGLEDSLWDGPGNLAESSRVQVERIRAAAAILYRDIATPSEARRRLALRSAA